MIFLVRIVQRMQMRRAPYQMFIIQRMIFRKLYNAINRLKYSDKDYFDSKSRFIAELGYIRDSSCNNTRLFKCLKDIYYKTADTSIFQNEVLQALAKQKQSSLMRY